MLASDENTTSGKNWEYAIVDTSRTTSDFLPKSPNPICCNDSLDTQASTPKKTKHQQQSPLS